MSEDTGFEPFLDFDAITDEMVDDLHEATTKYREAIDRFIENKSKENAAAVIRTHVEISGVAHAIQETIYTEPVMVHVSGPKKQETDDDGDETVVQRCKRCGSMLQLWREGLMLMTSEGPRELAEEDVPWWDEDTIVAKSSNHSGGMALYLVEPDRPLEAHEKPCPSLSGLFEG